MGKVIFRIFILRYFLYQGLGDLPEDVDRKIQQLPTSPPLLSKLPSVCHNVWCCYGLTGQTAYVIQTHLNSPIPGGHLSNFFGLFSFFVSPDTRLEEQLSTVDCVILSDATRFSRNKHACCLHY
jgi:hypothetical protein